MMPPDTWRRLYGQSPAHDQWQWSAQELDKIRLNLSSVDQFLSIACGLADNNLEIRPAIYAAARDAREAALLVDHLRSLFGHQLQLAKLEQHQQQRRDASQVAYGNKSCQNRCPPLSFHDGRSLADSSLHFTFSNRLALVRAAKSLVSNVAKILYLTDLAALQCCRRPSNPLSLSSTTSSLIKSRQQDQMNPAAAAVSNCHQSSCSTTTTTSSSSRSPYHLSSTNQKPSKELQNNDRPDNVANYSQLLRSFGELSTELIDLGQCIMLATSRGRAGRPHGHSEPAALAAAATLSSCLAVEDSMREVADEQAGGYSPPLDLPRRSPLDGGCQEMAGNGGDDLVEGHWWHSVSKRPSNGNNCDDEHGPSLDSQIQDMRALAQVNRLVIDRSILLLLSSSKCCLRQGPEAACGQETRSSIVSQIRASISIIMAIVKRSVFGLNPSALNPVEPASLSACLSQTELAKRGWSLQSQVGESGCFWQSNDRDRPSRQEATPLATLNGDKQQGQANNGREESLEPRQDGQEESNRENPLGMRLQIMDFFLKSSTGAQSAYDAINRLQVIVKPLTQLVNHKCFIEALNKALSRHLRASLSQQVVPYGMAHGRDLSSYSAARQQLNGCSFGQTITPTRIAGSTAEADPSDYPAKWWSTLHLEPEGCKENYSPGCLVANCADTGPPCPFGPVQSHDIMLMNKHQLVQALNLLFLGELRSNLVERVHEFTDCAYTKHEHRETIVMLLQCVKLLLNKLVRSIYKSRRKLSSINADLSLARVRQLAGQLEETCSELKFQLQTVVIEQSDELDRCNSELDLVKQMKHLCLLGDLNKWSQVSCRFVEQSEQLVEVCSMLNQVAPSNKMKINTKSLAIWFELNLDQLLAGARSLCQNPRSRVLKDCVWAYFQVWCSFYDDFCQEARQLAYLMNAHCDPSRSARVDSLRNQLLALQGSRDCRSQLEDDSLQVDYLLDEKFCLSDELVSHNSLGLQDGPKLLDEDERHHRYQHHLMSATDEPGALEASSLRSVAFDSSSMGQAVQEANESPRSLDHYHGFGANYRRQHSSFQADNYEPPDHSGQLLAPTPAHQNTSLLQPLNGRRLSAPFGGEPANGPACALSTCDLSNERYLTARSAHLPLMAPQPPTEQVNIYEDHRRRRVDHQMPFSPPNQLDTLDGQQLMGPMIRPARQFAPSVMIPAPPAPQPPPQRRLPAAQQRPADAVPVPESSACPDKPAMAPEGPPPTETGSQAAGADANSTTDQQSTDQDKWSDSDADAIVRGAKETSQMAESMYQFIMGEGDLNTTQDLFTQAELFAEEANELYKEVRCFSYKVPAGELKKELLSKLSTIPVLVQQLQFIVKNPTVGEPAAIAKVDSVIRETRSLMEAVNRVVTATLSCRQHYNMAIASMRKRTRTLSPSYRGDKGFEFENHHHSSARHPSGMGSRHGGAGSGSMGAIGSEPDIWQYGRGPSSRRAVARSNTASSKTRVSFLLF